MCGRLGGAAGVAPINAVQRFFTFESGMHSPFRLDLSMIVSENRYLVKCLFPEPDKHLINPVGSAIDNFVCRQVFGLRGGPRGTLDKSKAALVQWIHC